MSRGVPTPPPTQAPEIGRWGRLLGPFHVTGVFWYRLCHLVVRILPYRIGVGIALLCHVAFYLFLWRIRKAVASNLAVVLGPCGYWERQRRVLRTFRQFALCLLERYGAVCDRYRFTRRFEGLDHWHDVAARDGGFILATAHIGGWESASRLPTHKTGREVHLVRDRELHPSAHAFQRTLLRRQEEAGFRTHFAGESEDLPFALVRALRAGAIVALQGDRPRAGARTETVRVFGQPLALPAGVFALARSAGVPILPVFVFRSGPLEYRIVFREALHAGDRSAPEEFAAHVEWAIRQQPHQWFCWRRLWPQDGTKVPSSPSATAPAARATRNR